MQACPTPQQAKKTDRTEQKTEPTGSNWPRHGQCMAKSWPAHGRCMANSGPIHEQLMSSS
eukprot:826477-Lingulodinium_polyedra.AAC.1